LDVTSELWQFTWTPPGEGIYRFETLVDDWAGVLPPESPSDNDVAPDAGGEESIELPEELAPAIYLPWVAATPAGSGGLSSGLRLYLPTIANARPPTTDVYTGTVTTLYADLTPPEVSIGTTALNADHALGTGIAELSGTASDSVLLHRVDVRIDDGPWQRASLDGKGGWRFPWRLTEPPTGQYYEVSVRATDLAGRTTVVTETVVVDFGRISQGR
jgi:hypothetical protein